MFVVCEDHTNDQYIAVPVIQAAMKAAGKPNAKVSAVTNPRLGGISELQTNYVDIAKRYGAIGVVVFVVDRDGEDGLEGRKNRLASMASLKGGLDEDLASKVVNVVAVEELEVWALWGARRKISASWSDVRAERDPKEAYFDVLLDGEDAKKPGGGRVKLVKESLGETWSSFASGCPELRNLEVDLGIALA